MKAPIIIVEGNTDKIILDRFLPKDVGDTVEFGIANGSAAAQALARSILSANIRPVVIRRRPITRSKNIILKPVGREAIHV